MVGRARHISSSHAVYLQILLAEEVSEFTDKTYISNYLPKKTVRNSTNKGENDRNLSKYYQKFRNNKFYK